MLFNSFSFLIFLPIVAIGYYLLPNRRRWIWLLVASCYFYMAFIPAYILILAYLIAIDFAMGILIEQSTGQTKKIWLKISILANVGTLFFFKYFNFFNANVARVAALIHWNYSPLALSIILPLGLSFHTFQSLAYVIEVYKGRYKAERHLGIYALYVMFFPQLVAGPIERPQQLLPQLHAEHHFNEKPIIEGLEIMLWGFFKKVVIADTIGVVVDTIYGNLHASSGPILAIAAVAFAIQLYADFSGYSDIARGSAKIFGITLVNNFDAPFFSKSVAEFWRRWHISLSTWFRDYVYQPLALSWTRISKIGLYAALFFTFVVIGIWHGAGWTFIFFGITWGVYSVFGLATKKFRLRLAEKTGLIKISWLYAGLQVVITFILVAIANVFFRAPSLTDALYLIGHLKNGWSAIVHKPFWLNLVYDSPLTLGLSKYQLFIVAISSIVLFVGEYLEMYHAVSSWFTKQPRAVRWSAYYLVIFWILIFGYYQPRTFIYFQF
jgi:alginate O-acetyltransferase complex protein AlgI